VVIVVFGCREGMDVKFSWSFDLTVAFDIGTGLLFCWM
jgi:hypothetical protein